MHTGLPVAVNALNATGVAARSTTTGVGGGPITQWHARGIGGGGAFFNVAFHPTNPRLIMLTTDMGQCETSSKHALLHPRAGLLFGCET